ncbi:Myocilin opposite strand protein [Camelus dromedarius]|uniref:Myocilin opposite strand protein n=1 Tax=Camelus dromedarius TaxID=9838 RepID=A0A5N4CPY1_CAMDR|nr:myocilin opposite strand protein [Camelus dromedarius]KAB1261023.1 Myocilin opposite strand protein [Camelus dromedarius]
MAEKGPISTSMNFRYGDLASEVTRRRITMTTREEILTPTSDEAREILSDVDPEPVPPPPSAASPEVPPAPPPSPAEDPSIS